MRTIAAIVLLFSGMMSFSSCMQDTKATKKSLDSLALKAWEAEAEITGIETGAWKNLCAEAKQNVEFINYNFKDTMNRETALAIDNYAKAAKMLDGFVNDFEMIQQQVELASSQILKLKQDYEKRAQPLDSINAYIARETKNLAVLNKSVADKTDFARKQVALIQQHAPEVNEVVEKLKSDE